MIAEDIVNEARSWIGTPFHHQGRSKKTATSPGGVDCIGLVVGIARDMGLKDSNGVLLASYDKRDYSRLPSGKRLPDYIAHYLHEMDKSELQPGAIAVFRIILEPQHVGVITSYPSGGFGIIHAAQGNDSVTEHRLDNNWVKRITNLYRFNI